MDVLSTGSLGPRVSGTPPPPPPAGKAEGPLSAVKTGQTRPWLGCLGRTAPERAPLVHPYLIRRR